jgi:hypothetical protein
VDGGEAVSYEKDGIKYPRCTDIISDCTNKSDGLIQWAANQVVEWIRENTTSQLMGMYLINDDDLEQARYNFKETSQTALDVGSEVHNAIEKHLKGECYTLTSDQAKNGFEAFLQWQEVNKLIPEALELTMYSKRWAGTLDFVGTFNGKKYVIDWKTSKAFYPEMRYQVAAYRSVAGAVDGCGVLMLNKETGMPTFKDTSKTYKKDLQVFNKMLELYFLKHPRIAKRFEGGEDGRKI